MQPSILHDNVRVEEVYPDSVLLPLRCGSVESEFTSNGAEESFGTGQYFARSLFQLL